MADKDPVLERDHHRIRGGLPVRLARCWRGSRQVRGRSPQRVADVQQGVLATVGARLYRANQHHLYGLPWYEIPTRTTEQSDHSRTIQPAPLGDCLGCPTIDFPSSTHALLIERYTHRTSGRGGWAGCRAGLNRRGTGPDRTATGAENRVADRHRGGNQVAHTEIQAIKIATPAAVEWILDKAIQTHGAGQDFPLAGLWAHGVTRCPRPGHQGYDRHALGC